MRNVLSFDVGTTSMKCILFNENLEELFCENREYTIETASGGIAELDAEVYFTSFLECVDEVRNKLGGDIDISAVTFTTQGETLIPVDSDGKALTKAIVWLDTRAESEAQTISSSICQEEFYSATGLCGIDGALPLAKLMWIKKNMPDVYDNTYKFLLLEDYLIYRLTGRFVSEKSLQSSTGWYDIVNDGFYDKACDICGIDKDKLPEVLDCGTVVSSVLPDVCPALCKDTVVVTAAMDQISSAIGAGNIKEGIVTETTGTALVMGAIVEKPEFDISRPITIYRHYNDKFIYMPYLPTAGIVLKWFRDTIVPYTVKQAEERKISSYNIIDEMAETSPCGSNGVILNPDFTDGGFFAGISLATSASDLARSVLEGVSYMLRELIEDIEAHSVDVKEIYSLGGGSYSPLWCTIKASVCDKLIRSIGYGQTTALGAAILGFTATGVFDSVEDAVKQANITSNCYNPSLEDKEIYDKCYQNYKNYKSGGFKK